MGRPVRCGPASSRRLPGGETVRAQAAQLPAQERGAMRLPLPVQQERDARPQSVQRRQVWTLRA